MPLNEPGRWKYFISHVQRECSTEAVMMASEWGKQHCWLDRYMDDKSVAAMEEGVKGSEAFVCILSEGYFRSDYCCKEMRWAFADEKPIVSTHKNGVNVGAILNTAPDDFRERIMAVDSIALDASDTDHFEVCMKKIKKRLDKLGLDTAPPNAPSNQTMPESRTNAPSNQTMPETRTNAPSNQTMPEKRTLQEWARRNDCCFAEDRSYVIPCAPYTGAKWFIVGVFTICVFFVHYGLWLARFFAGGAFHIMCRKILYEKGLSFAYYLVAGFPLLFDCITVATRTLPVFPPAFD